MAHLDCQGVSVGVGGDGQEAVGTTVASAPDLWPVALGGAQDGETSVVEVAGTPGRPAQLSLMSGHRRHQGAERVRLTSRATSPVRRTPPGPTPASSPTCWSRLIPEPGPGRRRCRPGGEPDSPRQARRLLRRPCDTGAARWSGSRMAAPAPPRLRPGGPARPRIRDSRTPSRGSHRWETCSSSVPSWRSWLACRAQPSLCSNQPKANAPTSWPAASAITWLLADEPRLRKLAR